MKPKIESPTFAKKTPKRRIPAGLLLGALIPSIFVSCSGYFPLWLRSPDHAPGDPHFSGAWTGRWEHTESGHGGPMQALIPAAPEKTGDYAVKFRAGWSGFLWGRYTVPTSIQSTGEDTAHSLTQKDLGPDQGGTYSLDATITPESFSGTFRSKTGDLGTVKMKRPK